MVSELWGLALLRKWLWQKGSWTTSYQAVPWNGGNPKSFKIRQFYYWHPRLWWSHHFRKPHKIKKKRKGNQPPKNVYNPHIRNDSLKYCPFSIMFMQWFRIAPRMVMTLGRLPLGLSHCLSDTTGCKRCKPHETCGFSQQFARYKGGRVIRTTETKPPDQIN